MIQKLLDELYKIYDNEIAECKLNRKHATSDFNRGYASGRSSGLFRAKQATEIVERLLKENGVIPEKA